jgi:hypothetical protein
MRFLKTLTLNRRGLYDSRVALDTKNNFTLKDSTVMTLPNSQSSITSPTNGMIRYNTDTDEVEVWQGQYATWRKLRYKENTQITQYSLGNGNGTKVNFGPLAAGVVPTVTETGATWGPQNLLVYIEQVSQLSTTNYTVTQAPANGETGTGYWITFSTPVPINKPVTVIAGFDR